MELDTIFCGDALDILKTLPDESVDCCITSPPYWGLRDYGVSGQIGLEKTPDVYIDRLVATFAEVRRVLRRDGTLWLNIGDSYATKKVGNTNGTYGRVKQKRGVNENAQARTVPPGLKSKDLVGIPWRLAFALQEAGWYLRQDIIWAKPNPMPESVTDRCTKAHEYIFFFSKSSDYYFDYKALQEPAIYGVADRIARTKVGHKYNPNSMRNGMRPRIGVARKKRVVPRSGVSNNPQTINESFKAIVEMRNKRSVWSVSTQPLKEAHFAVFPEKLVEPMILAGSRKGGVVLDPFIGAGTTALVAKKLGRNYIGIELNRDYIKIAEKRLQKAI